MNRRERRSIEKKLGLLKLNSKQTNIEKFKRIAENVKNGKEKHAEFVRNVEVNLKRQRENREAGYIGNI